MVGGKGVDSDEKIADNCRVWVKTSIKKRFYAYYLLPFASFIVLFYCLPLAFVEFPYRKGKVSKIFTFSKEIIVNFIFKIGYSPRKNIVLRQVIKTSATKIVEFHEILVVTNLSKFPLQTQTFDILFDLRSMSYLDSPFKSMETCFSIIFFHEGK